jgi:valyl-tRNA synthetase
MSKTFGNVIDPLTVMDELGTDALRFTLLVGSTPGNDMNLSTSKVEANRNFANKVWNAGRFVIGTFSQAPCKPEEDPEWTLADSWIWASLQRLVRDVDRLFQRHQYGEAGRQIYDFFWGDFADWYLEIAKLQLAAGGDRAFYTVYTLVKTLDICLRLLHPFTPYVTEELWGHLKRAADSFSDQLTPKGGWPPGLIVADWPTPRPSEGWEEEKCKEFMLIQDIVRSIRNLRSEMNIKPRQKLPATIAAGDKKDLLMNQAASLASLARLDDNQIQIVEELPTKPDGSIALVVGSIEIYLPLADVIDMQAELDRLNKDLTSAEAQITRLQTMLNGPFSEKAPGEVVQKERDKLAGYQETAEKIRSQITALHK